MSMLVRRLLAVLLALVFGSGCSGLTIRKETMVAAFPPGSDEVRCLLVYEGFDVFGNSAEASESEPDPARDAGPSESDLKRAKDELKELTTGKTFKPPGWPLWFDLNAEPTDPAVKQLRDCCASIWCSRTASSSRLATARWRAGSG